MLRLLVKKQLAEVFRMYFYDAKKNRKRSTGGIILFFGFFIIIMVGFLGSVFFRTSKMLCPGLSAAGMDWLYFLIMSGTSVVLGAFGSVFNTYSGLYLSKDNDLLLSMPIPEKYIIASRLTNVYLLGAMYSVIVIAPAFIEYWLVTGISLQKIIGALFLVIIITLFVLVLSCILGWCVAKISLRLKRRSITTVIVSLAFVGGYYFIYFKATSIITDIVSNAGEYGQKIKGAAYILYMFGSVGTGDIKNGTLFTVITFALSIITWIILKKTFISIATSSSKTEKKSTKISKFDTKSVFGALFSKELSRFISSPNYMLNCGMGILFSFLVGIFAIIKGGFIVENIGKVFEKDSTIIYVIICALLFAVSGSNDMGVPSVSLEGKSIWIPQSLPVSSKTVLLAKAAVHFVLTIIPAMFAMICMVSIINAPLKIKLLIFLITVIFTLFSVILSSFIGIKMPNVNWTNELTPIKQSFGVLLFMFGIWGIAGVFSAIYISMSGRIPVTVYLGIWCAVFAIASSVLFRYVCTKGAEKFSRL